MRRRTVVRRLLGSLVLALTAVVGPATAAVGAPTTWDPRLQTIADKVAELRGLKFDHPVAAEFLSDAAFEKKVAVDKGKLSKQDKQEIERAQGQLRAVGLIGPDVDIVDSLSSLQTSGVLAYYDPKTKKITVKGTSTDDVGIRVTLAHELTHALQDQHFDLSKLEKAASKAHASTPLRTLVEGDAVRVQRAYADALSQAEQDAYHAEQATTSATSRAEITAQGVPEALSVLFEAPYDLGQTMLDAVIAKEQVAGVDALFANPPMNDAAFLTPSTLLEHRVFDALSPPALARGERKSGKPDVFGAFALYQILASRLDTGVALTAADAWGGDAMVTFTRHGTTCLRSTFVGKTPEGTESIAAALSTWATQMPAGAARVKNGVGRVTLTACDPGATATEAPNRALRALVFAGSRDGLFAEVLGQDLTVDVAMCTADTLVRDPAFTPIIDGATNDPSSSPDAAALEGVRARAREILADCRASQPV